MMLLLPSSSVVVLMLPAVIGILVRPTQAFLAPSLTTKRTTVLRLSNKREQFNPLSSMLGDMASSIFGGVSGGGSVEADPALGATLTELGTPWKTVRETLESLQTTPEERNFRTNLDKGYGPASPMHKVRLFDESNKEEDIRVVFYRDSASWCPYCQKVWLTLETKRIPYRIEKINMSCYGNKPASFLAIQPGGQIPVATIDGRVYGQSNDIIFTLEDLFPDHQSLRPVDGMAAQKLLRLERTIFSAWMYWLTGSGDPDRFRSQFVEVLNQVEAVLQADGPFFMGKDVTLVDFQFAPFLERMAASLLFYKGFMMRAPPNTPTDFPAVNRWFDAMEKLESYQLTKSDYYTHCWDLPPQLGGCTYEADGEKFEKAINGDRLLDGSRGSWELPLQPHNGGVEPDWTWAYGDDEDGAKREAVERISFNYNAIVGFAARGAGRKGMPPVSAPLADPNAVSNEAVQPGIHASLQVVCMAMLKQEGGDDASMKAVAKEMVKGGGKDYAQGVVDSLVYLRDRVGVPRDMRLPAARQLRAHLNWSIGAILDAM